MEETKTDVENKTAEENIEEKKENPENPEAKVEEPDWKAKVLYLTAEVENMKKRFVREKSEVLQFANEELIRRILPVLDNLQLAVQAAKDAEEKVEQVVKENKIFQNLNTGVQMTLKHFEQSLEQVGVKTVESVGKTFDPSEHEAISSSEDADRADGEVMQEMQKGYKLGSRLIRAARVVVNKNTKQSTAPSESGEEKA